jgi:hypothetical protein
VFADTARAFGHRLRLSVVSTFYTISTPCFPLVLFFLYLRVNFMQIASDTAANLRLLRN